MKSRLHRYEKLYSNGGISDSGSGSDSGKTMSTSLFLLCSLILSLGSSVVSPRCSYFLFAQLRPVTMSRGAMIEYERELREPTGAKTLHPPVPKIDGVLISRDCALVIELRDVTGLQ